MSTATWNSDAALAKILAAAGEALDDSAEMLGETANRTVPIEEATLAGSMVVTTDKRNLRATVSYDTPYAVRQHEDTRLRHDPGRRAKWLERTLAEVRPKILKYWADRIRKAVS